MHDTLSSLVERALTGNQRPLEFYLRDHSRLPGPRANLELANDMSHLLAASITRYPDGVRTLLNYFTNGDRKMVASNTPSEFIMLCGIVAFGACAAVQPAWREETFDLLNHYACSPYWRVREGVAIAYQRLLTAEPRETIPYITNLASNGSYLQQRAAIASMAEPTLPYTPEILVAALDIQVVNETAEGLSLKVPPYRVDVTRDVDVIEEILRIYGYNNIEIPTQIRASLNNSGRRLSHKAWMPF